MKPLEVDVAQLCNPPRPEHWGREQDDIIRIGKNFARFESNDGRVILADKITGAIFAHEDPAGHLFRTRLLGMPGYQVRALNIHSALAGEGLFIYISAAPLLVSDHNLVAKASHYQAKKLIVTGPFHLVDRNFRSLEYYNETTDPEAVDALFNEIYKKLNAKDKKIDLSVFESIWTLLNYESFGRHNQWCRAIIRVIDELFRKIDHQELTNSPYASLILQIAKLRIKYPIFNPDSDHPVSTYLSTYDRKRFSSHFNIGDPVEIRNKSGRVIPGTWKIERFLPETNKVLVRNEFNEWTVVDQNTLLKWQRNKSSGWQNLMQSEIKKAVAAGNKIEVLIIRPDRDRAIERGWIAYAIDEHQQPVQVSVYNPSTREHRNVPTSQIAIKHIIELGMTDALGIGAPTAAEGLLAAKQAKKYRRTLPNHELKNIFKKGSFIRQQNTGNCYLISALNNVAKTEHFETILLTSLKIHRKKQTFFQFIMAKPGDMVSFEVKVPLGAPEGEGEWLKFDLEHLQNQKLTEYGKKRRKRRGKKLVDSLQPVDADLAFQMLEAAYVEIVSRAKDITFDRAAIEGGLSRRALEKLFGVAFVKTPTVGYYSNNGLSDQDLRTRQSALDLLNQFDRNTHILSPASLSKDRSDDSRTYTVDGFQFYHNHSYSIANVIRDSVGKVTHVIVQNPHNTATDITLPLETFLKAFSEIEGGQINARFMFSDMEMRGK